MSVHGLQHTKHKNLPIFFTPDMTHQHVSRSGIAPQWGHTYPIQTHPWCGGLPQTCLAHSNDLLVWSSFLSRHVPSCFHHRSQHNGWWLAKVTRHFVWNLAISITRCIVTVPTVARISLIGVNIYHLEWWQEQRGISVCYASCASTSHFSGCLVKSLSEVETCIDCLMRCLLIDLFKVVLDVSPPLVFGVFFPFAA